MPDPSPTPPFSVSRPYAGVLHVRFPARQDLLGQVDLAFHFLRFQEFYESPRFKRRVFSWRAYVAWYKAVRGGFSYPWDWAGYNFPASVLEPFRRGAFDPLTRRERALLQALAGAGPGDYVIGTQAGDVGALSHELAHAFWHLDPAYRAAVETVLSGGDYAAQQAALAEGEGYDPEVFADEIQACAVEGEEDFAPDEDRCERIRGIFRRTEIARRNSEGRIPDRLEP